ncbi:MAG: hypothetical protein ABSB75_01820 [Candidatus Limnocylindrales bacterium]
MERSITQGDGRGGAGDLKAPDRKARHPKGAEVPGGASMPPAEEVKEETAGEPARGTAEWLLRIGRNRTLWGVGLVLLCLAAYYFIQPNRSNLYTHFILQAQAWLDGHTAIPMPQYQDVMPIGARADGSSCLPGADDPSCVATGYGIIPFPPMPAWVLLPFVSLWHLATNQQLLSAVFAAIDVGIAYWMLGYLPIRHRIRVLTSLFLGLGTVLWYTAAIGSTWFWAHVVAVGCLLLSIGLALSADRDAAEPESLREVVTPVKPLSWPGGWSSVALLGALGAVGELLFVLAGNGTSAAELTAVGVVLGVLAAALAVVVAGRPGVLGPFVIAVAIVAGLPAILLAGAQSRVAILIVDAVLVVVIAVLWWQGKREGGRVDRALAAVWAALSSPESLQVAAGILFGLAVTARLTILFGFPFFILVGGGGSRLRRGMLAGAGAAVPLVALLALTYATSGHLFNPAYDYLYHNEVGYPLNYHADWSITDIRYIPQNLMIMLFGAPDILPNHVPSVWPGSGDPACVIHTVRGLFDRDCPLVSPNAVGTSILLSSPALLLAPLAWRPIRRLNLDRATLGATIAVLDIAIVNLMHFSQGWVQFGYRFSNDFIPFALILVALGASRLGRLWPVVLLVGASIVVNFWGTMWGVTLGW